MNNAYDRFLFRLPEWMKTPGRKRKESEWTQAIAALDGAVLNACFYMPIIMECERQLVEAKVRSERYAREHAEYMAWLARETERVKTKGIHD